MSSASSGAPAKKSGGCAASSVPVSSTERGDVGLFPCPDCQSIFKRRDHLGRHMMTQHSSSTTNRTKCPFKDCDTEMVRRDHLRRHISQVHKVDPSDVLPYSRRKPFSKESVDPLKRFKCVFEGCDAELSRKDHLCRHIKNIHKKDPREVIGHMYKQPKGGGGNISSGSNVVNNLNVGGAVRGGSGKKSGKKKKRKEDKRLEENGGVGEGSTTLLLQSPQSLVISHHHGSTAGGNNAGTPGGGPGGHSGHPHPSTLSDYDYGNSLQENLVIY